MNPKYLLDSPCCIRAMGPNSTVNKNISIKNLLAFSELMVNSVIIWAYLDQMLMFIYIRALNAMMYTVLNY